MNSGKIRLSILALILVNIIWGASFPIYKIALEVIPPASFVFLRFFIGALLLLPFVYKDLSIRKQDVTKIILASIFGITIPLVFLITGLKLTESINAPIILSTGPIILLIGSYIFLKERLKLKTFLGTIISLLGVLVIVLMPVLGKGMDGNVVGNVFFVIAAVGGVVHVLLLKKIIGGYKPLVLTFWTFLFASLPLVPVYIFQLNSGWVNNLNSQAFFGIIYGALIGSALAYSLYAFGIKYIKAGEVGIFTYVDPIATIIVAIPLLGEQVTIPYIVGSILVFLGIFVAEGRLHYHPFHMLKSNP